MSMTLEECIMKYTNKGYSITIKNTTADLDCKMNFGFMSVLMTKENHFAKKIIDPKIMEMPDRGEYFEVIFEDLECSIYKLKERNKR